MKKILSLCLCLTVISLVFMQRACAHSEGTDPLPAWRTGTVKSEIIHFVQRITDKNGPDYVPVADRIATFDNDGTLWVEMPVYPQFFFDFDRIAALAPLHPEWRTQPPFSHVLNKDYDKLQYADIDRIMLTAESGMTVSEYNVLVKKWLSTARDPRFKRHYTELTYEPMLEVMAYLRKNQFRIYIVSGGNQDLIRGFSETCYGIPVENVIGAAEKLQFHFQDGKAELLRLPKFLFKNDGPEKAEDIHLFIGKKPLIAFGNSAGDRQMLEWTQANPLPHMMVLIHHDDAKREYAYDKNSTVGRFPEDLMQEANNNHWLVISMKNDWKQIFSFQP